MALSQSATSARSRAAVLSKTLILTYHIHSYEVDELRGGVFESALLGHFEDLCVVRALFLISDPFAEALVFPSEVAQEK